MSEIMTSFHFLRPLFLLALLPAAWLLWMVWRRKQVSRSWSAVCDPALLPYLLTDGTARSGSKLLWVMAVAVFVSIIALAGPAWKQLPQPLFEAESALIIALDLSRSMDSTDIKPSRLARARHKITDILDSRREGQTALIVYAADAFVVCPLTDDVSTIRSLVESLDSSMMPSQGSRPDRAVKHAAEMLKKAGSVDGQLLLISDDMPSSTALDDQINELLENGHDIALLAVGTADGAPIPMPKGGFVKDSDGSIVIPKLDIQTMQSWAVQHQSRFATLTTDDRDIQRLLVAVNDPNSVQTEATEQQLKTDLWQEEGPWLLLLVLPLAALCFRRGWLLSLLMLAILQSSPAEAMAWKDLWQTPDQQASQSFDAKDYGQASSQFENREWQAASHYKAGDYQKSIEALEELDSAKSLYNKGNALAKMGKYPEALTAYDAALKKAPKHEDALYNRKLVEEAMSKEQSEGEKSDQGDSEDKDQKPDESDQNSEDQQDSGQQEKGDQEDQSQQSEQSSEDQSESSDDDKQQSESQSSKDDESQSEEEEQQQAQQSEQQQSEEEKKQNQAQQMSPEQLQQQEAEQANEAWLRRVPDDPGGLLRRKFKYQYQQRDTQQEEDKRW